MIIVVTVLTLKCPLDARVGGNVKMTKVSNDVAATNHIEEIAKRSSKPNSISKCLCCIKTAGLLSFLPFK